MSLYNFKFPFKFISFLKCNKKLIKFYNLFKVTYLMIFKVRLNFNAMLRKKLISLLI